MLKRWFRVLTLNNPAGPSYPPLRKKKIILVGSWRFFALAPPPPPLPQTPPPRSCQFRTLVNGIIMINILQL